MRLKTPPPVEYAVDRSGWSRGPWDREPDRREWRQRGVPCLAVRNDIGAWCGYAGVFQGHPWYEVDWRAISVRIRGGLSFSGHCFHPVCHVPKPGEPADVWWVGFDCMKPDELFPNSYGFFEALILGDRGRVYRDLKYVARVVNDLASQAEDAFHTDPVKTPATAVYAVRPDAIRAKPSALRAKLTRKPAGR